MNNSIDFDKEIGESKSLISAYMGLDNFINHRLSFENRMDEANDILKHALNRLSEYPCHFEVNGCMPLDEFVKTVAEHQENGYGWGLLEALKSLAMAKDSGKFKLSTVRARKAFNELLTAGMFMAFNFIEGERAGFTLH
ncbi:hypothetical protein [Thiomicrorhabdus indica]|uniref:hypothetical protein n=1 Tax=Thiomicrorhabdus indica TaxID=2267253 RepID=UPI00102DD833|nr:hypothetical protein [Thiomicrorhabdus indica]